MRSTKMGRGKMTDDELETVWNLARLWAGTKVPPREAMTACWLSKGSSGHGARGKHRVHEVWEAVRGPLRNGDQVTRLCGVRTCLNPAHLTVIPTATKGVRRVA